MCACACRPFAHRRPVLVSVRVPTLVRAILALLTVSACQLASPIMASSESCATKPDVRSFPSGAELSPALAEAVAAAAAKADPTKPFTVAISGGSLPKLLAAGVVRQSQIYL